MRIGIVLVTGVPFPTDIRVEKEIKALCPDGHTINVLTMQIPDNAPEKEAFIKDCAHIYRTLPKKTGLFRRLWGKFRLVNPRWVKPIEVFISETNPDVLHVHDLPMVPVTIEVAQRYNIPVVADLHENWPAMVQAWHSTSPFFTKLKNAVINNYYLMRLNEARYLKRCIRVIVVVPEAAERLSGYGVADNKIVVVSNTEDETTFSTSITEIEQEIIDRYHSEWMVSYIGGIGPHRGIDTVLRSLPYATSEIPKLKLVIVGAKEDNRQIILAEARKLGIENNIEVIDWIPFEKVTGYILASRVCLVPHNNFEHTQTTVPHKLFQYMISGKPVLVSDCRPLARIVRDTRSGLIFEANNSQDCANKLIEMYQNPDLIEEMGHNGRSAALGPYAWRNDAKKLVQTYREIEKEVL